MHELLNNPEVQRLLAPDTGLLFAVWETMLCDGGLHPVRLCHRPAPGCADGGWRGRAASCPLPAR